MFFENKGPFKLSYIKSKCAISGINFDGKVNDIKGLNNAKKNDISFLDNSKYFFLKAHIFVSLFLFN